MLGVLLVLTSCVNESDYQSTKKDLLSEDYISVLTKTINNNLSFGVNEADVINYLSFRKQVSSASIKEISKYSIDNTVYVFFVNLFDGRWFIMAGDYSCAPIIAEGKGKFFNDDGELSKMESNWLQSIGSYIKECRNSTSEVVQNNRTEWLRSKRFAIIKNKSYSRLDRSEEPDTTEVEIDVITDTLYNDNYPALTITSWHQIEPFNNAIPLATANMRCPAGCAVIAIAQLLYYTHYAFGFPNNIYASASCSNYYYQQPYNYSFSTLTSTTWDYMEPSWLDLSDNDPYTAALSALISFRTGSYYGIDSGGAYGATPVNNIAGALATFGLTNVTRLSFLISTIMNEIQNERPVLCDGYGHTDYTESHSYLIDGYKRLCLQETEIITDTSGHILSQNVYVYDNIQWWINTGGYPNHFHILSTEGTYIPYYRYMYTGWSQY